MADPEPGDGLGPPPSPRNGTGTLWHPLAHGLPAVCAMLLLRKFATDFRRAATIEAKKDFFGDWADAAAVVGYFDAANVLLTVLSAPLFAALSDAFGRRPLLLWEAVVIALPQLCLYLRLPFWWYLVVDDILPVSSCIVAAFVADLTYDLSPADRAFCYGLVEAAHALGSLAGYGFHAALAHRLSAAAVFRVSAAASVIGLALATAALPESLGADKRRRFRWSDGTPLGALRFVYRHRRTVAPLVLVYSVLQFQAAGQDSIVDMYNAARFDIRGARFDGYWLLVHAAEGLAAVLLVKVVATWWSNEGLVLVGAAVTAAGYGALVLGTGAPAAFAAGALNAAGAVWDPALMALVVALVPPSETGAVQGALACVAALSVLGAPVIFGDTFDLTAKTFPAFVWLVALGCTLLAILLMLLATFSAPKTPSYVPLETASDPGADSGECHTAADADGDVEGGNKEGSAGRGWVWALAAFALLNVVVGVGLSFL